MPLAATAPLSAVMQFVIDLCYEISSDAALRVQ